MNDAQKALEQWLKITGLKMGDKVLVVDGAEGWRRDVHLLPVGDGFVGEIGAVTAIHRESQIKGYAAIGVRTEKGVWHDLPFWCLVKVEDKND
jgi:hypothetical protein